MSNTAGVTLTGIGKSFGATAVLRDVNLTIRRGEFLTLLGPSGCGKSTLLRILAGLDRQDKGEVRINGRKVDGVAPKARDVAMVFQTYALYPGLSVRDNLALPLRMRRLSSLQRLPWLGSRLPGVRLVLQGIDAEVAETARVLQLEKLLDRKPAQLSGGQRQRVALGRAMVRHPAVFLMDEPLSNLDGKLRAHMREEIANLRRRVDATFVYVTHDHAEAMTLSDRVAVMIDGEILQVGAPAEVYAQPSDVRVAELIGSPRINILAGVSEGLSLIVAGARLAVNAAGARRIGVRPEDFQVASQSPSTIAARIERVEHLGSELHVFATALVSGERLLARLDPSAATRLSPGGELFLRPDPERLVVFDDMNRRITAAAALARPV